MITGLEFVMLCLTTIVSFGLSYVALMNVATCLSRTLLPKELTLAIVSLILNFGSAVILAILTSLNIALAVISIMGFIWALLSYFLGQRFEGRVFASNFVNKKPMALPLLTAMFFALSFLILGLTISWYWSALPAAIWIAIGFTATELAIKREILRAREYHQDFDRPAAIFALNEYQGRLEINLFATGRNVHRYPFP